MKLPPLALAHLLRPSPCLPLPVELFRWAREVGPAQPYDAAEVELLRAATSRRVGSSPTC